MKCLVITGLFCLSLPLLAVRDERQLLKCLGAEEKQFHLKKETGPLYDLNQRMISEMIQIPKAELDQEYFDQICSKDSYSPSLILLELSIKKGPEIFNVPDSLGKAQKQMAVGMVDDYIEATKEIFLNLITQIQAQAPSPTCLKEEIPELDNFFSDIKYLQEDVDMKAIFAKRDVKIFRKLKSYPQAFDKCRERIKKKLKSESKAADKKS